jgi:energy-converting hydrogenase A subunit M
MDKSEQMEMMKLRVLRSFKWNAQIVHPLAQEFDITDEEFDKAEELSNNIWDAIDLFISSNFVTLDIEETYEIAY